MLWRVSYGSKNIKAAKESADRAAKVKAAKESADRAAAKEKVTPYLLPLPLPSPFTPTITLDPYP